MPRNRDKRRCEAISANGRPCACWARRGSDPPRCWRHAHFDENPWLRHDYYRNPALFSPPERAALAALVQQQRPLEAAILMTRLRIRGLMTISREGERPLRQQMMSFRFVIQSCETVRKMILAQRKLKETQQPAPSPDWLEPVMAFLAEVEAEEKVGTSS